jgi:hypothetical protein
LNDLKNKINTRLDELEKMLLEQKHISDPHSVAQQIESISKFWSILNEEDRDYVQCAQFALEVKSEWKR